MGQKSSCRRDGIIFADSDYLLKLHIIHHTQFIDFFQTSEAACERVSLEKETQCKFLSQMCSLCSLSILYFQLLNSYDANIINCVKY